MEEEKNKSEITTANKLHRDSTPSLQPNNTTPFILNGVEETIEGDKQGISNESGNVEAHLFPSGFVPLHSVSIGNERSAIFLANGTDSIIAVKDREDNLNIVFDDRQQSDKMGFSLNFQIDAEYRLRRGCETTLYWVDPKPRKFIIERPDKFKKDNGEWDIDKFLLQRTIEKIPRFYDINVNDSGGNLKSGSYIFSIQYLDQDYNSTEFISSCKPIRVYEDNQTDEYREIEGSSEKETDLYENRSTLKSIEIVLEDLDEENFPFYRIAISEINTGSGTISKVYYTDIISTGNNRFTYTGNNFVEEGTREEVQIPDTRIEEANHIDQVDNMLMLSNTKGIDADLCNLQKYASKIQVDVKTKKVQMNIPEGANPKNPTALFEGIGYMPGEIYSLAVFYVLEGGYITPGFHIPGKSPTLSDEEQFETGSDIYPMSTDNESSTQRYTDNSSCGFDYWGLDSQGNALLNEPIRHHRFPLRSDIDLPLVKKLETQSVEDDQEAWQIRIDLSGEIGQTEDIYYELVYEKLDESGNPVEEVIFVSTVDVSSWDNFIAINNEDGFPQTDLTPSIVSQYGLRPKEIKEIMPNGSEEVIALSISGDLFNGSSSQSSITYSAEPVPSQYTYSGDVHESEIMGLHFSNVDIPSPEEIGGRKIIGYFFGRNERNDENKTVLDTAVIGPSVKNLNENDRQGTAFFDNLTDVESNPEEKYISHSFLFPEISQDYLNRVDDKHLFLITPEYKFRNKQFSDFSEIVQQGVFSVKNRSYSRFIVNDVVDGTTYNSDKHRDSESDDDGWQLHVRTRQNLIEYESRAKETIAQGNEIEDVFYLDALESKVVDNDNYKEYINLSADNKVGVVSLKDPLNKVTVDNIPYVVLKRNIFNPYPNFRSLKYLKISQNYHKVNTEGIQTPVSEFGGDTYISSMSYTSTVFYRQQPRKRRAKSGFFDIISGVFSAIAGVLLTVLTAGIGVAAGAALIGFGASMIASGIRKENFDKVYGRLYKEGLRETVVDSFMSRFEIQGTNDLADLLNLSIAGNPTDDEIQWGSENSNLFFESSVNMGLRHGANKGGITDFMPSPSIIETGNGLLGKNDIEPKTRFDEYILQKMTKLNDERDDRREYIGVPKAELYNINKDYLSFNVQKYYNHLPLEYDCCSDCSEVFSKRIHYSLQSFSEELTDNYAVFLPNNYRDIQGETGEIKDVFVIQNNIYIITQHALWHLPQNYQERVTGQIISFIGTGGYFNTPPRKIVDDNIDSAGTSFKQAVEKTRHGVLIVSDKEDKVFLFDGEQLEPISNNGMRSFFRKNMGFSINEQYYGQNQENYPYLDNPSNSIGAGFHSVYDSSKQRFLLTKKDFRVENLPENNYMLCSSPSGVTIFENVGQTIANREANGWTFKGIENCQLKFERYTTIAGTQQVWSQDPASAPDVTLKRSDFIFDNDSTNPNNADVWGSGQINIFNDSSNGEQYFKITAYNGNLVTYDNSSGAVTFQALSGQTKTFQVSNFGDPAEAYWIGVEGYYDPQNPMEIYMEKYTPGSVPNVETGNYDVDPTSENLPTEPEPTYSATTITRDVLQKEVEYVEGAPFTPDIVNTGFTLSFSLSKKAWLSFHSYIPSFYLKESVVFYSWVHSSDYLWKHLEQGFYNNFYGERKPFILELISNNDPLITKTWENITFQTKAEIYDYNSDEFLEVRETFNKAIFYNSYQVSGNKDLVQKTNDGNYMVNQIQNNETEIILDRNERDYSLNEIRDYRKDSALPMFLKRPQDLQSDYFIDKKVNTNNIDNDKDWTEIEYMRDKYLVVRLIFDNFEDTKLTFIFSTENVLISR